MSASLATVAYIGATILFILSLGGLSNQETARRGNLYGMIGMSLAVLAQPVAFGNAANDPVSVVFGLAALDHDKHLELLAAFANKASTVGFVNSLLSCGSEPNIRALLS